MNRQRRRGRLTDAQHAVLASGLEDGHGARVVDRLQRRVAVLAPRVRQVHDRVHPLRGR